MSKDSKAKSNNRWSTGLLNKKEREAMERYGLDPSDYGYNRPDRGTGRPGGTYDDMREDFTRAAMNDYDTRRALEASAMSGKKKAMKLAEKGFKNPGDVMNANNLQRKQHERAGNGGSFSSASDFAGLTMNQVQRDRRKFNEDIDKRIAAATPEEQQEQATTAVPEKVSVSPEMQAAKDKVKAWESGSAGTVNPYGGGSSSSVYGAADDAQDQAAIVPDSTDSSQAAAQSYLSQHKEKDEA